jgi:hypothetical protein
MVLNNSILKVIFIDPFEQNLSFTFFLLQLLLLSNDVAENPGPDNKVGDLTVFHKYNTFFKQLTIGYNENMYTKFDHKKKNYYTIQGNKENKIKHNNIVDYVQIRGVFRNFWDSTCIFSLVSLSRAVYNYVEVFIWYIDLTK